MEKVKCPACGHETAAESPCSRCGHAALNGTARTQRVDPPPPPEVANWVIERPTPEMLEEARRTFDEAAYLAGVREIERTGGVSFEEIMAEIERKLHGRT